MISIREKKYTITDDKLEANNMENVECREGVCNSTDTKPMDWENGSILLEMDTGKIYIFDEQNALWRKL